MTCRRLCLSIAGVCLLAGLAVAQESDSSGTVVAAEPDGAEVQEESLDDLFEDPAADIVVDQPQADHLTQYTTASGIRWSGNFNTTGGVSAGWTGWPVPTDLSAGFDGAVGLVSTATIYMDARPDPDFRIYGYLTTSMNPVGGAITWSGLSLGELFVDYTWLGNVFVRLGKHAMVWGQGRLFEAYTNVMSDAGGYFSLRASMPTWLDGVSAVALINHSGVTSYRQVTYAGKADLVVAGTLLSAGARWQQDEGLNALVSIKKVVWHVDLLADLVYHYDASRAYAKVLAGFFREWDDAKLYGEYWYDGSSSVPMDQTVGLAFGYNNLGDSAVDFGLQWLHTFVDGSGSVTAGITWTPWKFITATLAVPVAYGVDASRYVTTSNSDPAGRRVALVFGLEMDVSF